jgi:hypothetical protein
VSEKELDQPGLDDEERASLRADEERDHEQDDAGDDDAPSSVGDDEG